MTVDGNTANPAISATIVTDDSRTWSSYFHLEKNAYNFGDVILYSPGDNNDDGVFEFQLSRNAVQAVDGTFSTESWGFLCSCKALGDETILSGSLTKPVATAGDQVVALSVSPTGDAAAYDADYVSLADLNVDIVPGDYEVDLEVETARTRYHRIFRVSLPAYNEGAFPDFITTASPEPDATQVSTTPLLDFDSTEWESIRIEDAATGEVGYEHAWADGDNDTHQVPAESALAEGTLYRLYVHTGDWGDTWLGSQTSVTFTTGAPQQQVASPVFGPASGAAIPAQGLDVTITCATVGTTIWYTTNGSEPAESGPASTQYTAPIHLTETTTVKARAFKAGMSPSTIASATYTNGEVATHPADSNANLQVSPTEMQDYIFIPVTISKTPSNDGWYHYDDNDSIQLGQPAAPRGAGETTAARSPGGVTARSLPAWYRPGTALSVTLDFDPLGTYSNASTMLVYEVLPFTPAAGQEPSNISDSGEYRFMTIDPDENVAAVPVIVWQFTTPTEILAAGTTLTYDLPMPADSTGLLEWPTGALDTYQVSYVRLSAGLTLVTELVAGDTTVNELTAHPADTNANFQISPTEMQDYIFIPVTISKTPENDGRYHYDVNGQIQLGSPGRSGDAGSGAVIAGGERVTAPVVRQLPGEPYTPGESVALSLDFGILSSYSNASTCIVYEVLPFTPAAGEEPTNISDSGEYRFMSIDPGEVVAAVPAIVWQFATPAEIIAAGATLTYVLPTPSDATGAIEWPAGTVDDFHSGYSRTSAGLSLVTDSIGGDTALQQASTVDPLTATPTPGTAAPVALNEDSDQAFSVVAGGGTPGYTYVWTLDSTPIDGPESADYTYEPDFDAVEHPAQSASKTLVCTVTDSASRATATATWTVNVTDVDQAPSAPEVSVTLQAPTTVQSVIGSAQVNAVDPDHDDVTYSTVWTLIDGETEVIGSVLHASDTLKAQTWEVAIWPLTDPYEAGTPVNTPAASIGTATVIIANTLPLAGNVAGVAAVKNGAQEIVLTGTDPDEDDGIDTLTFAIVTQPEHGTLTEAAPGSATYTYEPVTDYIGPDSFEFEVDDGTATSEKQSVTITVLEDLIVLNLTGASVERLEFGVQDGASPAPDAGIDRTMPPPPPDDIGEALFLAPEGDAETERLQRDVRGAFDGETWQIEADAVVGADIVVTWDAATLPQDRELWVWRVAVRDGARVAGTAAAMADGTSLTIPGGEKRYYIIGDLVSFDLALDVGWNLISLPLVPLDSAVENVFDEANFTAADGSRGTIYADSVWAWIAADGLYRAVTTMTPKTGCWIYVDTAGTLRINGHPAASSTVPLGLGWNAVGVAEPTALPANAKLFLPAWWWNAVEQTYHLLGAGDVAHPGIGFWIYALEATELVPEP